MPAGVPPGLEVIADDHAIEADLLGVNAEIQKLDRAELLGRRLVAKSQRRHTAFDSRRRCLLGSSEEVHSPMLSRRPADRGPELDAASAADRARAEHGKKYSLQHGLGLANVGGGGAGG